MSQYPNSPYTTPYVYPAGYGYDPYGNHLAPARRAGILMFIVGGLGLVCGVCMGVFGTMVSMGPIIAQGAFDLQRLDEIGMSPETFLRAVFIIISVISLLVSVVLLALAPFVRRGSGGAILTAIVISILGCLFMGINILGNLVEIVSHPNSSILPGLFIAILVMGVCVLLVVWLFQARRGVSAMRAAQAQYQMQYWQYQQQMQAQQGGYGYSQASPSQPPQVPPAPPATS